MTEHNLKQEDALEFILGNNALFTVKSQKTGTRFTYKVLVDCKNERIYNVSVLTGPDNVRNYRHIGHIYKGSNSISHLFEPHKSIHTKEAPSTIAFEYIFNNLCSGRVMPQVEIWHNGRCCRCGRILTVPESISMGIGPECVFKI